jgi:hypothetical protein
MVFENGQVFKPKNDEREILTQEHIPVWGGGGGGIGQAFEKKAKLDAKEVIKLTDSLFTWSRI